VLYEVNFHTLVKRAKKIGVIGLREGWNDEAAKGKTATQAADWYAGMEGDKPTIHLFLCYTYIVVDVNAIYYMFDPVIGTRLLLDIELLKCKNSYIMKHWTVHRFSIDTD
jgi:hypothetical protein